MNYIGSKRKLSDFIISNITSVVGSLDNKIFAEIFAGTGIISRKIKTSVNKIIANDFEYYSYVLLKNYIGNHFAFDYNSLIKKLNSISGKKEFIFKNYCRGGGTDRNFFSDENGMKIDGIRIEIENWNKENRITKNQYYFLLASLLESADKIANTASVYGAYLKHIKKSAQKLLLLVPALFNTNENEHEVYNEDANMLITKISGDVLYLDPPYNHRQYGANYHLLNTIALYDNFEPRGKTGLREYKISKYCRKNEVTEELNNLIKNSNFKYIFLSYNNEGLMPFGEIKRILSQYGKYDVVSSKKYQRFKADQDINRNYSAANTTEYLHILEKN